MRIALRPESARHVGIDVAEGATQFVADVPDEQRPDNLKDDEFSLSPRLLEGRLHLYLNDPIAVWWGVNNEHLVAALDSAPPDAPITLHVNCPGGSVFDARAMQATLAERDVEARIEGLAASAASWLVLSASRRTMTVGSRVLVHETRLNFRGCTSELAEVLPVMRAMDVEISEDYASASGTEAARWLEMMRRDKGRGEEFGAARAKELKLVDEVVQVVKPRAGNVSTRVDKPEVAAGNKAKNELALLRLKGKRWN